MVMHCLLNDYQRRRYATCDYHHRDQDCQYFRTLTPHHLGNKFNSSFSSSSLTFLGPQTSVLCLHIPLCRLWHIHPSNPWEIPCLVFLSLSACTATCSIRKEKGRTQINDQTLIPTFRRTAKIERQNTEESIGYDVTIISLRYNARF